MVADFYHNPPFPNILKAPHGAFWRNKKTTRRWFLKHWYISNVDTPCIHDPTIKYGKYHFRDNQPLELVRKT